MLTEKFKATKMTVTMAEKVIKFSGVAIFFPSVFSFPNSAFSIHKKLGQKSKGECPLW
jgi:hypothetical protein